MRGSHTILLKGGPNLVLTWVVTKPNDPPQYIIVTREGVEAVVAGSDY